MYKINNKINKKNRKGFVILIAIVVSSLLVSLGMFIGNVAHKELILSVSGQSSQAAFFIADSVIECALRHDIRGTGFKESSTDGKLAVDLDMECNNILFAPISITESATSATSVYYISFANDTNNDRRLSSGPGGEIELQRTKPYAKLVVEKVNIGAVGDKTTLRSYGHNIYSGAGVVERAIEVTY